jgi:hypothetical protein
MSVVLSDCIMSPPLTKISTQMRGWRLKEEGWYRSAMPDISLRRSRPSWAETSRSMLWSEQCYKRRHSTKRQL